MKKKNLLKIIAMAGMMAAFTFGGCTASCERSLKSCNSNINGGLHRVVNIYDYEGELIATYEGLIDIDNNENGSIISILCVEDGSVDLDELEEGGLKDGQILVYRQGAKPPYVLKIGED